jgi:hypothetical protein
MKLSTLAFVAAALAAASPASAMSYSWRAVGDHIAIDAAGEIELHEKAVFSAWVVNVAQNWSGRKATAIILNSPGGNMIGGDGLAGVIYQNHMITGVAHGGFCASACVEVWASGTTKTVPTDGGVGVHHATGPRGDTDAEDVTTYAVRVYQRLGAPQSVIDATYATPSTDIHFLTRDEYAAWNAKIIP